MDIDYSPEKIERKWQNRWQATAVFSAQQSSEKRKFYCLEMFPYPSGYLHMGHVRNYSMGDALAWYKRLSGYNVIHPFGWDSFGQPAEQAAIKHGIQPRDWTERNIEHMRAQLQQLGISYDWSREIATHRPDYYHWNQWFFLRLFQHGLVYKRMSAVNWCPKEQTVLSNEQSAGGVCWRCSTSVVTKELEQWFIRITNYADRLLDDMKEIEASWPESVLTMQRNWIGKDDAEQSIRLRDWCISRQRLWGTPIPIIYCQKCGTLPVPVEQLPILLPENAKFTGIGGSPLAYVQEFVNTQCPQCNGSAVRETDTMDTFIDSSWYMFRYCDPKNGQAPFDSRQIEYWMPVDQYIGGIDQAVMHLLYLRFWTKVIYDIGLISFTEPVHRLLTQGMVTNLVSETGEWKAMSKSLGNGVDPEAMIDTYGADAVRLFVLFAAPPEGELRWSEMGIEGTVRFLRRVYKTVQRWCDRIDEVGKEIPSTGLLSQRFSQLRRKTHWTIARVTEALEQMRLNTAIAALMEFSNVLYRIKVSPLQASLWECSAMREALEAMVLMLAPFAPHTAEELWETLGYDHSILQSKIVWPVFDKELAARKEMEIPVQVNGKLRVRLLVMADATVAELRTAALSDSKIRTFIRDREIVKVIVVPQQVVNIVVH
ncbi:MAG: class I tRNA ligase family protein [Acidobacteriota bacterium]